MPPESTNLLVPKNSLIEVVEASSETIRDAVETSKRLTDLEISLLIGSAISDFQDLLFDTIDTMNIPSAAKAYVANPITFQGRLSREKISMRRSFSGPMFGFRVVFDDEQLNFIESNAEMCCHQLLVRALDTVKVSPSSYGTLLQMKEERNTQAHPKLTKPILLNLLGETEKLYGKESLQAVALGALVKCTAGGYPEE